VTTAVGARGIETGHTAFIVCEKYSIAQSVRDLAESVRRREELGTVARRETERHYAWERISDQLGTMLHRYFNGKVNRRAPPFFSVIVPTFARPKSLTRLIDLLDVQSDRDFEVIVVDQSDEAWSGRDLGFDLDLLYVRTPIRGAVPARNLGASLARGHVLAFIDDDCEPCRDWLKAARQALFDPEIAGLEGRIVSSHVGDPEWRAVTNESIAGFGFMTANLFVRASAFARLNGFDIAFEDPHFREDTDLGWRLETLGPVPYSTEAWVYHPPHRRNIARESQAARDRFFEKDILLLKKHPARYRKLFHMEAHWCNTDGFWSNFLRGAQKYGFPVPEDILEFMPGRKRH
jgi:glycosyltransferase involved in cell wall biosynthesis